MAEINITITNLPEIKAAFAKAPRLMTAQLNLAIKKSLFIVEGRSKRNTPVLTGRLRSSHRSIFGNLKGEVGTHTNYDMFIHEGTRFMRPRPFLRTAVIQSDPDINKYFTQAVDKVLSEIASNT